MFAKYILAIAGSAFLVAALARLARDRGKVGPAAKTWLIVGGMFVAVSAWIW